MSCKLGNLLCITALIGVLVAIPLQIKAATIDVKVSEGNDDAEERVDNGEMYLDSTDLEIVDDTSYRGLQIVGVRFQNVTIPQGAVINSAYIEFEADENSSENDPNLVIVGEDTDQALTFNSSNSNISTRPPTEAFVHWNIGTVWTKNKKYRTPDLTLIVQHIVNRKGWSSGNAMAFIILGTGKRTVEAYNGEPKAAPLLHIDYTADSIDIRISSSSDDAEEKADSTMYLDSSDLDFGRDISEQTIGVRFQNVTVPQGALISRCYIEFETDEKDT